MAIEQLIRKYETMLAGLGDQSVETPEVFGIRAKLAFLKSWHQVVKNETMEEN